MLIRRLCSRRRSDSRQCRSVSVLLLQSLIVFVTGMLTACGCKTSAVRGVELIRAIENMEVENSRALGSPPRPPFLSMVSRFVTVVRLEHAWAFAVIETAISFTFMVFLHSVDLRQMDPGFSMFSIVLMVETRTSTAWARPGARALRASRL